MVANQAILTKEQFERYRAVYCGLCRVIGKRHGQIPRFCLTYDMTFLALLLDSLEEPELSHGNSACLAHPTQKHLWRSSQWTDYCADMNVALAYHNCLDDWQDDKSVPKLAYAKALEPAYKRVKQRWAEQCRLIEVCLKELNALENAGSANLDGASACFGRLMAGLFTPKADSFWNETLSIMGDRLGRFIYVMDAVLDEKEDEKRGRYNPAAAFRREYEGFDPLPVLQMLIGECTMAFERLPLEQDLDLLRNILYSGVWSQWNKSHNKETEPS